MSENLKVLENEMKDLWRDLISNNSLIKRIKENDYDERLYALYLIETFHYTSHNAKNQAAVILNIQEKDTPSIRYMKYCLKHALEEVGHELMAYHDLVKLGFDIPLEEIPESLSETETLVAYLYHVAQNGNPLQRLGYSFWAEDSYKFFSDIMEMVSIKLNLKKSMMTFFHEHSQIDEHHAQEVRDMISFAAKTQDDWGSIQKVMSQTLILTGQMLEGINREYESVLAGTSKYNELFKKCKD